MLFLPVVVVGTEISETNEIIEGETSFYSQSTAGVLSACAIEYEGIDKDLNLFSGSYGFLYFEDEGLAPVFKVRSSKLSLDGSKKRNPIKAAWIQTPFANSHGDNWVSSVVGDSFLLVGNVESWKKGGEIYIDIVTGKVAKIGFLHEGSGIDRVYQLKALKKDQEAEAILCLQEILAQTQKLMENSLKK